MAIGTAVAAAPLAARQHHGHGVAAPAPAAKHQAYLAPHEFATLRILCDLILPADDTSPAASATGASEYIDRLCRGSVRIARTYDGGLVWLDATCAKLHGVPFREAAEGQRIAILEKIAYPEKTPPEWQAGAVFFDWVRKMTLDGYYTSPAGYRDVGYQGGKGMTTYQVPEEALRQALSRWKP
ncbi:MAG: gluconate 2-dehydrogenase subunit 3 family protein [Acidobacteria bacterium]|nr:gluconate 2-dehydrogenase subunit 3 family protein [Acidobacteriota bacterium]